ncbi:hypothetical protein LPN04_32005 [Rugamonas sp. A1-17]|nr:hypothetical protein [Rugamonas sp. A1-17]
MDKRKIAEEFERVSEALYRKIDEDPHAAIVSARSLLATSDVLDETNRQIIASIILTDAGAECRDYDAVHEAIGLLEHLHSQIGEDPNISYNLANALITRANLTVLPAKTDWCVVTSADRIRAKELFQLVAQHPDGDPQLRSRALNNLGNALAKNWRLIEAYDCYSRAIEQDPQNGVAISYAAQSLTQLVENGLAVEADVAPVIASLVRRANANADSIVHIAGSAAGTKIRQFLDSSTYAGEMLDLAEATEYQQFVAANRLALTPTIEGLNLQLSRWDSLRLGWVMVQGRQLGVPPIFAMFNVLKSDFLAARFAAYLALKQQCPESGQYQDTLDHARYSTSVSMMGLAQKSCFDLLDKTAVATSAYLGLPGKSNGIYFSSLWFVPSKGTATSAAREFTREVSSHILDGDFPLIALAEVARDLGGYLKSKKAIRHAATHRFTVLHDIGCEPDVHSEHIEHFAQADFETHLIESLQMVRAVLFYFVNLVAVHERRKNREGVVKVIEIPDHDIIRGD